MHRHHSSVARAVEGEAPARWQRDGAAGTLLAPTVCHPDRGWPWWETREIKRSLLAWQALSLKRDPPRPLPRCGMGVPKGEAQVGGTPPLCQPQHRGLTSVSSFTGHRAGKWSMRVPKLYKQPGVCTGKITSPPHTLPVTSERLREPPWSQAGGADVAAAGLSSQLQQGRGAEPCPAPCGERDAVGPVPCPLRALSLPSPSQHQGERAQPVWHRLPGGVGVPPEGFSPARCSPENL